MRELKFQKLLNEINNEKHCNAKKITYKKKFYKRNLELGIDAGCFECDSHKLNNNGYPRYYKEGYQLMHRLIFYKATGEKPEAVMHLCDNPQCINPRHLQGGTKADNNKDRAKKGRTVSPSGEKHGNSKLSTSEVNEIKTLYKTGKYLQKELGEIFNVAQSQINKIVNEKQRKNG